MLEENKENLSPEHQNNALKKFSKQKRNNKGKSWNIRKERTQKLRCE